MTSSTATFVLRFSPPLNPPPVNSSPIRVFEQDWSETAVMTRSVFVACSSSVVSSGSRSLLAKLMLSRGVSDERRIDC